MQVYSCTHFCVLCSYNASIYARLMSICNKFIVSLSFNVWSLNTGTIPSRSTASTVATTASQSGCCSNWCGGRLAEDIIISGAPRTSFWEANAEECGIGWLGKPVTGRQMERRHERLSWTDSDAWNGSHLAGIYARFCFLWCGLAAGTIYIYIIFLFPLFFPMLILASFTLFFSF